MIHIKVRKEASAEERQKLIEKMKGFGVTNYGTFNKMPEPFSPCADPHDYLHHAYTYSPLGTEFRQIPGIDFGLEDDKKPYRSYHIEWYGDQGWAVTYDYWRKLLLTVRLGCDHNYKELSVEEAKKRGIIHWGMCYHVLECSKCGHIISYDSSG